jgi:hypothetical protein
MITFSINNIASKGCQSQSACLSKDGCPTDRNPDFTIKSHDTKPPFKVAVEDCDGPIDLTDLVVEANMWALAKLKLAIDDEETTISFADGIGFQQVMVGDVIVMDRARSTEYMLATAFDETNKTITVERGWLGTTPSAWIKGQQLRILRILNGTASTEMVLEDILNVDGHTDTDQLTTSYLVYEWRPEDTCVPGCYWFEFKVMKMLEEVDDESYTVPPYCAKPEGVDWIRRYPSCGEGFLIKIEPTLPEI